MKRYFLFIVGIVFLLVSPTVGNMKSEIFFSPCDIPGNILVPVEQNKIYSPLMFFSEEYIDKKGGKQWFQNKMRRVQRVITRGAFFNL